MPVIDEKRGEQIRVFFSRDFPVVRQKLIQLPNQADQGFRDLFKWR